MKSEQAVLPNPCLEKEEDEEEEYVLTHPPLVNTGCFKIYINII
jgi:hypothetical protein